MNTDTLPTNVNLEPRWSTYLKSAAFVAPAILMWAFTAIFVLPKLKWICMQAGMVFPPFYRVILSVTEHFVIAFAPLILLLALLEWRSTQWPRYRKAFMGISVFVLNTAILILVTASVVLAIMAAPALMKK